MTPRMNLFQNASAAMKAMLEVEKAIDGSGLDHRLLELVKLRASQINGCAFCIYMHAKDATKNGESDMRIHLLDGWRDTPVFTARERAALGWTESLTRVAKTHAPDADYALLKDHFDDKEIANLTVAIGAINLWNRVQIGARAIHPVDHPVPA